MANELMFQVGIQEVKEKIDDIRKKFDDFEKTYGQNGITVKLNLQGAVSEAETLIGALKNIGSAESLKPYESELGKVKQQMEQVANASKSAANAGKSAFKEQESTADNLSIKYATLIQRIENWQANLSQLLSKGGHSNYFDSQLRSAISSYQYLKERVMSSGGSKEELDQLRAAMTLLGQTYANVNKEAKAFNKEQERAFELEQKADSRAANVGVTAAEKKRAEMEAAWREQEQMQQKQLQALEKQAQREEQLAEQKEQKRRDAAYKAAEAEVKARQKAEDEITKVANKADERLIAQKQKAAETIRKANERAINALDTKVGRLEARKLVDYSGLDTSKLDAAIKKIREIRNELAQFAVTGTSVHGGSIAEITKKMGLDVANREATVAMQALNAEKRKGAQATSQLTSEEQRLASAIGHSTGEMRGQSQVLSDLKSMAMQYVSVWGASNLLHNIIEIGGQLEMQRMSIGAILGDVAQANDLFEKIKGMAIQSPFGVVELDQMTKQLTAYGFQSNELFDMTKRLADISAATGTGVDRLALALGHVRSEAALSGYTLRQFSMGNIPLAQKLADRLSEIEGHFVSVADVRKRVSKKEIGYEDVVAVLKDLTDDGGMFYNMQETISQSVKARFKNLRDSLDIMYGEIAESKFGDNLKNVATILTQLTRNWQELGAAVAAVATVWVSKRAISFMNANALGAYSNSITYLKMQLGSLTATEVRELAYAGKITKQEMLESVAAKKLSVEDAKLAAAKWNLTEAQLAQVASSGKVDKALLANSISTSRFSVAQLRAIATMREFSLFGSKRMAVALNVIGTNLKMAGSALLGFVKAAVPMFALTAIVEMWMRYKQTAEQAGEAAQDAFLKGSESVKNLSETIHNLPKFEINAQGVANLDDGALRNGIKKAVEDLKTYSEIANDIVRKVNETNPDGSPVMSLAEQYNYLRLQLEETNRTMEEFQRTSSAQESAINSTGGLLGADDNVFKDLKDYYEERKNFIEDTNKFYNDNKLQVAEAIEAARAEDAGYRQRTEGMKNYAEMLRVLTTESDKWAKAYNTYWNKPNMQGTNFVTAWSGVGGQFNEAKKELDKWAKGFQAAMEGTFGYNFSDLSKEQFNNIRRHIWEFSNSKELGTLDEQTRKWIRDYLGQKWNIKFSSNAEVMLKEFDEMQTHIQNLVGKEWVIKLKLQSVGSFEGLYDQLDKDVKEGKETMKKLGSSFSDERKKQITSLATDVNTLTAKEKEYRDAYFKTEKAKQAAQKEGFKLSSLEEKTTGGGKGSVEDKNAKAVRERVRIIKEAADAFQYWRDKVGEKGAWNHVIEEFGDVLAKIGITADNVQDLRGNLNNVLNSKEFKAIKDPKVKLEVEKEVSKEKSQLNRKDFEKTAEEFSSKVQIELDSLTRAWEIFNNVREATGNVELAVQLSGAYYSNGKTRNLADALRDKIQKDFDEAGGGIAFDINLSDKDIEDKIKAAVPAASEKQIKGLVDEYKKWRDLQRDVLKNDIDMFNKLIGSAVDLQSQLRKVTDEYAKQIASLDELKKSGKITNGQYNQAKAIADANLQMKTVQAKKEYQFLMDGVVTMTKESARTIKEEYVNALKRQLAAGVITAKEYADKIDEVNNRMRELEYQKSDNMAYMQGGIDGLVNNKKRRGMSMIQEGGALQQEAQSEIDGIFKNGGSFDDFMNSIKKMNTGKEMESAGKGLSEFANGMGETIDQVGAIVHGINNVVQGVKAVLDEIDEMNAALGDHGSQYDGSRTFFNAFSSASQKATNAFESLKSGDFMGTFAGIVGSFTQWVTVYAKAHDADLDRQIELAEQELKVLSNIDSRLDTQISRTLGGATRAEIDERTLQRYLGVSELRNKLRDPEMFGEGFYEYVFTHTGRVLDNMSKETREAVSTALKNKSAISAQYASLLEQRDLVQRQLDAERDKKDSDESAIEEYQQKLYELEDQIQYFVEDVAKELYGLDLKGWASQIGDALMTAFENGEDAAKAFNDTVKDIMRSVVGEMIKLNIIEPAMEEMRKELFGYTDSNGNVVSTGVYNSETGRFNEEETLRILGKYLGEDGVLSKQVEASEQFYEWAQKVSGIDLSSEDTSSSTGSSIKGITENTADLLASYLNAIRADVSVDRNMIAQYYPMFYQAMTSGNASLANIENHTAAIMRSNDAIQKSNQAILDRIDGLKNKAWKLPMA